MKSFSYLVTFTTAVLLAPAAPRAGAALTPYWVSVPISAAAVASDPLLASQQTWSLRVAFDQGFWHTGSMRVTLPADNVFYNHPLGSQTRPPDVVIAAIPSVAHDTYVTSPRQQTSGEAPHVVGAHPTGLEPASFGGPLDTEPGVFSVGWNTHSPTLGPGPGDYEIARLTFPANMTATVQTTPPEPSYTSTAGPTQFADIPPIPEPRAAALTICVSVGCALGRRHSQRRASVRSSTWRGLP